MKSAAEPSRSHESDWRRTITAIRNMLVRLEPPVGSADERAKGKQAKAAAWVSNLVERLVAAATAEIEAATRRTRVEADIDIAQLQVLVAHLQRELEIQRGEVARLLQRLETETARNARLTAAFQAVQRVVSFVEPPESDGQRTDRCEPPAVHAGDTTPAPPASSSIRPLKLISNPDTTSPDPELAEYVRQAFDTIESTYWEDLRKDRGPADIVDRLTENLRSAYDLFGRRVRSSASPSEATLFEQQLTALLDSRAETSFGRHLAVAAYNYAAPQAKTRAPKIHAEASPAIHAEAS